MSRTPVLVALRRRVAVQAQHRCGYCLTPEELTGAAMEVEHIIPEALGGQTVEENLGWVAGAAMVAKVSAHTLLTHSRAS
jgi:HNH endonuclease